MAVQGLGDQQVGTSGKEQQQLRHRLAFRLHPAEPIEKIAKLPLQAGCAPAPAGRSPSVEHRDSRRDLRPIYGGQGSAALVACVSARVLDPPLPIG